MSPCLVTAITCRLVNFWGLRSMRSSKRTEPAITSFGTRKVILPRPAFVAEQGGFNCPIRFFVVLDAEHRIHTIRILEHGEDPGLGELVTRPAFLEQFTGLDKDSAFSLGVDVQGVSGATISSPVLWLLGCRGQWISLTAPSSHKKRWGEYADGTYYAEVDSFGGKLELEVVIDVGKDRGRKCSGPF